MLKELRHSPKDPELKADRLQAKSLYFEYNHTAPGDRKSKDKIIRELLGKCGKNICIISNFCCDYGYNIEIGDDLLIVLSLTAEKLK